MRRIELNGAAILVTGAAGFIGASVAQRLLTVAKDAVVVGLDDMNGYYDPALKEWRLKKIEETAQTSASQWRFVRGSISDAECVRALFEKYRFTIIVHLAAQAGVRYSLENPAAYVDSNLTGFFNIMDACRQFCGVQHFLYASSSSVYGETSPSPFRTDDPADRPVSLYAATKRANEILAHSYSRLYRLPSTGLRFFTVYGPYGRPDMFYFSAAESLIRGEKIKIFNNGESARDFTYISDTVEGVVRALQNAPEGSTPYVVHNLGAGRPTNILQFARTLADSLASVGLLPNDFSFEDSIEMFPMQPGDVPATCADSSGFERDYGFTPEIRITEGLSQFAAWFCQYKQSHSSHPGTK